ncbi:MAG: methyltransferase domain-containing protein, partial [Luteolibacter sp.]
MPDAVHDLYQNHAYPPMSHPLSDPAVSAVAAKLGGLEVPHPRRARILEIGGSSGHNLSPLARRWPGSRFTGIDLAQQAIADARGRASAAWVGNVVFHCADLRDFEPVGGTFDFIIAHGFFSWVADEAKEALLLFCRRHLSPNGIATISFNLECGWKPRLPVIAKARAIQQAGAGDIVSALQILRSITDETDSGVSVIDDMLAKGAAILACDDFAPVNDPWPLDRFVQAACNAGLRWLGESDPGANLPSELSDGFLSELRNQTQDPLEVQLAVDEALGRTFRSGVLCRDDAPVAERVSLEKVMEFFYQAGAAPPDADEIVGAARSNAPACQSWSELMARLPEHDERSVARRVFEGITRGWLRPRIEPVAFMVEPPAFPLLDPFRLLCARKSLPLVDAWHRPCLFPAAHYQVLAAMDGSGDQQKLATLAKSVCPDLH